MKKKILNVLLVLVMVVSFSLVTAVASFTLITAVPATPAIATQIPTTTYNVIPFSLSKTASGVAAWTSAQHHTGSSAANLTAPATADYARVKLAIDNAEFISLAAPSFYYRINASAVATTEDIGATWPMYERSGATVSTGYLSPYPVIYITDGTTPHYIIGQPWAESTKVGWTLWNNATASNVTTAALWHDEAFTNPGIGGSVPAGWGPLSYFETLYTGYTVVGFGVGLGSFTVTGQQTACVDDITVSGATYNLEGTSDDYSTFQAAIDEASTGDIINVYAGLYSAASGETFPIEVNVADLTIKSVAGAATTIISPASADQSSFNVTAAGVTIGGSSIGFTIDSGGRAGLYADETGGDGITVQGCIFKSYGNGESRGMWFENLWDGALITGNSFTTPRVGTGIMVVNADGATISNNTVATGTIKYSFLTFKAEAFYPDLNPGTPYAEYCAHTASTINDVSVTGNSITGVWQASSTRTGIAFAASKHNDVGAEPNTQDLGVDVDGVIISGNTFTDNNVGVGIDADRTGDDDSVATINGVANIQIVNNNFDGNDLYGVYNGQLTVVDAENNWWGNASGPVPNTAVLYTSYGDVAHDGAYIDYQPWLLAPYTGVAPTTYDFTLALKDGWTLVSTDKEVTTGTAWVGTTILSGTTTVIAYKYVAGAGYSQVNLATQLTSVDAFYVKTDGGGGIGIIYSTSAPGVVTKNLAAGWNLISCAGETDAYNLLSQLRYATIGTEEGVGLTSLVSQGDFNQFTNSMYVTLVTAGEWTAIDDGGSIELSPFDGYWVYMNAAKIYGVIPDTLVE